VRSASSEELVGPVSSILRAQTTRILYLLGTCCLLDWQARTGLTKASLGLYINTFLLPFE
jgi:hypothetical protein